MADAMSRAPLESQISLPEVDDRSVIVCPLASVSDERRKKRQRQIEQDRETRTVLRLVRDGWPEHRHQCEPAALPYWNVRGELAVDDELLVRGSRLIIPIVSRPQILQSPHAAHQGIDTLLRFARANVYWPGLAADIRRQVEFCSTCQSYARANSKETLMHDESPP